MSVYPAVNGIPAHDTITQVNSVSNTVTLAAPTTAQGSGTLDFVSGNCLDLHDVINPSHFYGLVTAHCNIGIHIDSGGEYEFHGWVGFSNNINVAVSGSGGAPGETISFFGAQFQLTNQENLYLDQRNQAVVCFMCKFQKSASGPPPLDVDGDADIVISPSAGSGAPGNLYPVLQMSAPQFGTTGQDSGFKNILFDPTVPNGSTYCNCRVTLDGLSVDYDFDPHGASVPSTNLPSQILAGNLYAPLQYATGIGTTVLTSPPTGANFAMTFGAPSRLYSYLVSQNPKTFTATNGGSGNWNVNIAYDIWDIERSGPTTAFTDQWDTAANIIAAINNGGSYVSAGQKYGVIVCNSTGWQETISGNTGDTLVPSVPPNIVVAPGTCGRFTILINSGATTVTIFQG